MEPPYIASKEAQALGLTSNDLCDFTRDGSIRYKKNMRGHRVYFREDVLRAVDFKKRRRESLKLRKVESDKAGRDNGRTLWSIMKKLILKRRGYDPKFL